MDRPKSDLRRRDHRLTHAEVQLIVVEVPIELRSPVQPKLWH